MAGLDEAGRGPLAGPVTAAAVKVRQFPISNFQFSKLRDSKKLSAKQREKFYKILIKHPQINWGVGIVSEKIIDRINILEATKLAMVKAIANLKTESRDSGMKVKMKTKSSSPTKIDFLILDGNFRINSKIPQKPVVKGDEKVFSVAAASILAKVTRDRIMVKYDRKYPQYGFDKHKGYPTRHHFRMLRKYGPCRIHRMTFRPVRTCRQK